ncbi:Gldg family protein [Candidatus Dojkabacteria bacterium]|nr:Gldg family protein [Candidatus Dojkabacteria bacterium]
MKKKNLNKAKIQNKSKSNNNQDKLSTKNKAEKKQTSKQQTIRIPKPDFSFVSSILSKLKLGKISNSAKIIFEIVRKELTAQFSNPAIYVVIAVCLVVLEFFFFYSLMQTRLVDLRPLLDNIPWLFIVLIPAVTMSTLSQENIDGTIEFYLTQPITEVQLLIGKYLSNLIIVALAVLSTVPSALSLSIFGKLDWGQVIGQYLAILVLASTITAIGTFVSSIIKNQIGALLVSMLITTALILMGTSMITETVPLEMGQVLERISIYTHYQSLSRGIIDFKSFIYLISLGVAFLIAAYLPFVRNKYSTGTKEFKNLRLGISLSVILVLCVAVIGQFIPGRIDLTQSKKYSLSQSTKDIISNADDIINITVYASSKVPAQFQSQYREVRDMLNDYENYSNGKVNVTYKYPDKDSDVETEALEKGITQVEYNVMTNDEISVKKGYLGILISYVDETEVIPFIQDTSSLEYDLTSKILQLTSNDQKIVAFIEDKSTHSPYYDYTLFKNLLDGEYEVTTINISGQTGEDTETSNPIQIPEDIDAIILAGTTSEFTEEEKQVIFDYLDQGGSMLALIDPVTVNQQSITATLNENSQYDFFEDYGIEVEQNLVYDLEYNEIVTFSSGDQPYIFYYPFWTIALPSKDSPITSSLSSITTRWPSSIKITDTDNVEVTPLLKTSASSYYQTDVYSITPDVTPSPTEDQMQELTLAVSVTKKVDNKTQRIVVIGNSEILSDTTVQANQDNLQLGVNTVDWLSSNSKLAEIRQKNTSASPLLFTADWQANILRYGNIIGIAVIILSVGTVVVITRNQKTKKKYKQEL